MCSNGPPPPGTNRRCSCVLATPNQGKRAQVTYLMGWHHVACSPWASGLVNHASSLLAPSALLLISNGRLPQGRKCSQSLNIADVSGLPPSSRWHCAHREGPRMPIIPQGRKGEAAVFSWGASCWGFEGLGSSVRVSAESHAWIPPPPKREYHGMLPRNHRMLYDLRPRIDDLTAYHAVLSQHSVARHNTSHHGVTAHHIMA